MRSDRAGLRTERLVNPAERYVSILTHLQALQEWLSDPAINEIAVNRPGQVHLWQGGVWRQVDAPRITLEYLEALGHFLANISQKPFDEANPILSAHLPGGERIEMTRSPAAARGKVYLNLRKHTSQPFVLAQFFEQRYFEHTRHVVSLALDAPARQERLARLDPVPARLWKLAVAGDWSDFLTLAVKERQNVIVSGATGCGKTSFVRALIELIPAWERLITVEDTPEMPLPHHPNSQALFYRRESAHGEGVVGATVKQVLEAVMRKTPDRVLLAELRGDETFYYVQNILNSGHPGGITTVHANSPQDALTRIALLVKASPEGRTLSLQDIMGLLQTLVHAVVQLEFDRTIGRHAAAIYYDPCV
jgi:type IV secretion system protein VirB11